MAVMILVRGSRTGTPSRGRGMVDSVIAVLLEGQVTVWLVAGLFCSWERAALSGGTATPPQPHPAPRTAQPPPCDRGRLPGALLAGLLSAWHPAGRWPRAPAARPRQGAPRKPRALHRAGEQWRHSEGRNKTKQEPTPSPQRTPRVSLSVPQPVAIACLVRRRNAMQQIVSGPVGRVWFLPQMEGRTWLEVTA